MLTAIVIPNLLDVSFRKKLFDNPDFRKIHKGVVPRLGGFSFFPSVFLSVAVVLVFSFLYAPSLFVNTDTVASFPQLIILASSTLVLFLVGLKDDLVNVKYIYKFYAQGIASLLTVLSGIYIGNFHGLFGIGNLHSAIAFVISLCIIVFILNAVNLIDGIDGLASGLGIITFCYFGAFFFAAGDYIDSLVAWASLASVAVFFCFNYFGKEKTHKKIFMGDIGSLTMGMIVAYLTIRVTSISPDSNLVLNPIVIAFSPLVIPFFDVVRVFIFRIKNKKSPFLPDKSHIHHRLMDSGLSPHKTLFTILVFQILLILVNLILNFFVNINVVLILDIIAYVIIIELISKKIVKTKKDIINA